MSIHEWYGVIYGIEFPYVKVDGDKILAFIENHKKSFEGEDLPKTAEEAIKYAEDFEDDEDGCGLAALIVFAANNKYIHAERDEYGCEYIGMFADAFFPWAAPSDGWASIRREDIESEIHSLVEELGIECPKFDEHIIWYVD